MPPSSSIAEHHEVLQTVLDPGFMRKLDRLRMTVRRSLGSRPGNTPVRFGSQPSGLELTDYKEYAPGDDPRAVDWNAYGRFDVLWVKRFRAEREAPLEIIVDVSGSMAVPASDAKLAFAIGLAASLTYVSLRQQDPVRIVAVGHDHPPFAASPLFRHVGRFPEIRTFLAGLTAIGRSTLPAGVEAYVRSNRAAGGIAVVLSDFLAPPAELERALTALGTPRRSIAALRLIGPVESDPARLPRRARLRDAEQGGERLVTLTAPHCELYRRALDEHLRHLKEWCSAQGQVFLKVDTAQGLDRCLFEALPQAGLVH
jgi:uncharacterized protein (DUF58 family)